MIQFVSSSLMSICTLALILNGSLAFAIRGGPPSDAAAIANESSVVAIIVLSPGRKGLCTGTLISNSLVLTAAHCFAPDSESLDLDLPSANAKNVFVCFKRDLAGIMMPSFELSSGLCRPIRSYKTNKLEDRDVHFEPSDLAIIAFDGGLPAGKVPLSIFYGALMVNEMGLSLGYGIVDSMEHVGSLNSLYELVDWQDSNIVVTHPNLGIGENTPGDSGGPLLVVKEGKPLIAGVIMTTNRLPAITDSIFTSPRRSEAWIREISIKLSPIHGAN